jgi:hypothetical protein
MTMNTQWQYQIRIYPDDEFAEVGRRDPDDPAMRVLNFVDIPLYDGLVLFKL